jgi:hypothetical protein
MLPTEITDRRIARMRTIEAATATLLVPRLLDDIGSRMGVLLT